MAGGPERRVERNIARHWPLSSRHGGAGPRPCPTFAVVATTQGRVRHDAWWSKNATTVLRIRDVTTLWHDNAHVVAHLEHDGGIWWCSLARAALACHQVSTRPG